MPVRSQARRLKDWTLSRIAAVSLAVSIVVAGTFFLISKFPFRRDAVLARVEGGTGAHVEIGTFHSRWFPPGFIAGQVRLSNRNGDVLTIDAVALKGSYTGLLRNPQTVYEIHASGLHLIVPAGHHSLLQGNGSKARIAVGEIRLEHATIDLLSATSGRVDRFLQRRQGVKR